MILLPTSQENSLESITLLDWAQTRRLRDGLEVSSWMSSSLTSSRNKSCLKGCSGSVHQSTITTSPLRNINVMSFTQCTQSKNIAYPSLSLAMKLSWLSLLWSILSSMQFSQHLSHPMLVSSDLAWSVLLESRISRQLFPDTVALSIV